MIISAVLALGLMGVSGAAPDDQVDNQSTQSVSALVVGANGEYIDEPSVQIDLYQFEQIPGGNPISLVWAGRARDSWGTSYAYSSESFQFFYTGKAKAAGNVYQNLRIVQVCIWYSRGSSKVSATACSIASSNTGAWLPGSEVSVSVTDTLNPFAPQTIFNIQTTRISPLVL